MKRLILLAGLLFALLISGCQTPLTPEPEKAPAPESTPTSSTMVREWTLRMAQSGGIMGLSRSIEVTSNGAFSVTDNRTNKTIRGTLTAEQLSKFNELITSFKYRPEEKPNGMVCADCFIYDLEINRDGEKFAVQLSDISLPNSECEVLIRPLGDLMNITLK